MKSSLLSRLNDAEVAAFDCCGDEPHGWQQEVQDFICAAALRRTEHVVGLRDDDDQLIAISCFDPATIKDLPISKPIDVRGWSLIAIGVAVAHQGLGHGKALIRETLVHMEKLDRTRTLIEARVHQDNAASLHVCADAGIQPLPPLTAANYLRLFGGVPGTPVPDWFE